MNDDRTAWIIVRAFGIYFAAQFIASLFTLIGYFVALPVLSEIATGSTSEEFQLMMKSIEFWINIGLRVLRLLLYLALSYYCLYRGEFVHRLLIFRTGERNPA